jgi:hypothetical protein
MSEVKYTAVCADLNKLKFLQGYPDTLTFGVHMKYSVVFHLFEAVVMADVKFFIVYSFKTSR